MISTSCYFNSRPREGANTGQRWHLGEERYFNSRPREGANRDISLLDRWENTISIPAPARGRTGACGVCNCLVAYFNSRPREGANKAVAKKAVKE